MYSAALLDHFENPRNAGALPQPAVDVEVTNPVCGDILRLSVEWKGDRVDRAAFLAKGCTASIAMGSALTELIIGQSRGRLAAMRPADIEHALGGLINESKHVAVLAIDALKALLSTPAPNPQG